MTKKVKSKSKNKQWSFVPTFVKDGISERDYLLIISTLMFFFFVAVGLIMVLLQKELDAMYLSLLDMVALPVSVIIGGYFGVNITETVVNRPVRESTESTGSIVNVEKAENVYEAQPIYEETQQYGNEDDPI